ncbi:MAG: sulfurtransferase [Gammaproteobacteria bacterium]|nr:sulfurtransferase [Gammaproteobacteria bacterium]
MYSTIITSTELMANLGTPGWRVFDCRFSLADTAAGARAYAAGHIPGAVYVNLDQDLSGPPRTDHGRHPLPSPDSLVALFSRLGIDETTQVVVYDDARGAIAARMWWLLRYMGHSAVAVLDGGWQAYLAAGGQPSSAAVDAPEVTTFKGQPDASRVVLLDAVPAVSQLVDAREPARYAGQQEPIDPVAGHIPGAINRCWQLNVSESGFLPQETLAASWREVLGTAPDADTVHYCGSGVTACHNVLAQVAAGFPMPRLYCGSWSEWCRDASRPVASR